MQRVVIRGRGQGGGWLGMWTSEGDTQALRWREGGAYRQDSGWPQPGRTAGPMWRNGQKLSWMESNAGWEEMVKGLKVDLGFGLQGWGMKDRCVGLGATVGWREGQGHGDQTFI